MQKEEQRHTPDQTDLDIIEVCRKGNKHAYRLLIERYKDAIYSIALRFTRDPGTAEEVTQETFVKAWKHLHRFEGRSKFSTWLTAIAVNKAKDMIKGKQRIINMEDMDTGIENRFEESNREEGPEQILMNEELGIQLRRLIGELPVHYREAFMLRHIDLLSYEEISSILAIKVEAVKMRVFRAREMLKERLFKEGHHG